MADDVPRVPDDAADLDDARLAEIEEAAQRAAERYLEIEEEIAQTRQQFEVGAALNDEFNDRLEAIERRAKGEKARRDAQKSQAVKQGAQIAKDAKGLGAGLTIAYAIIGLPLAGAGIGWLLDRAGGGTLFVTVGTLLGAALGIAMALYLLNRENSGP